MDRGYVKLWRRSISSGWIRKHDLWVFWTYCLMKASHKRHKVLIGNQQVELEPGQFPFGRRIASEETGLSERKIRSSLDCLKNLGNVTIKSTNKFSIITVVNWDIYQGDKAENDQLNDQRATSNRPHTRMKEGKEGNKNKEKYGDFVLLAEDEYKGLCADYGKAIIDSEIEDLNLYIGSKGKSYKSHAMTIRAWLKKDGIRKRGDPEVKPGDLCRDCGVRPWVKHGLCRECFEKLNV